MKFKPGQEVIYVDPFIYTLSWIMIDHIVDEFYVCIDGGLYAEDTVFVNISQAKQQAHNLLDAFYTKQRRNIDNFRGIK